VTGGFVVKAQRAQRQDELDWVLAYCSLRNRARCSGDMIWGLEKLEWESTVREREGKSCR
jgi:hypothetical protein